MLKISDIRELMRLMDETSVHELRIESNEITVTMKKADLPTPGAQTVVTVPAQALTSAPATVQAVPEVPVAAPSVPADPTPVAKEEAGYTYVKSPMVGTFYRAPSPTSPPYVEVGTRVNAKTVVCIVEAMKLMNEIEADVQGEIVEILAENGHLVEYGQPLFKVKTA